MGREAELAQLRKWCDRALAGERQVVFVIGKPGIGKTTLLDAFVTEIAAINCWIGHGQCIEQYGAGEAYLPLLEAFGRLGRGPDGVHLVTLMNQYAPNWLWHLPALVSEQEYEMLHRRVSGVTPKRMMRELAEAVEILTMERPLVLVLEDLHWSDTSTLEWLAYVSRRRESARLLVIGTYRPVDAMRQGHPLRSVAQELQRQSQSQHLTLNYLSETGVAAYLTQRFAGQVIPDRLPQIVHQRTNGNPLFMISLVEDMMQEHMLPEGSGRWQLPENFEAAEIGVPEALRELIEHQLERLEPEAQRLLEAASVAGRECSAMAIAAGSDREIDEVEFACTTLARQHQYLQECGTVAWPDGTIASQYRFCHALYQEVLYERVPAGRKVSMHQRIGQSS